MNETSEEIKQIREERKRIEAQLDEEDKERKLDQLELAEINRQLAQVGVRPSFDLHKGRALGAQNAIFVNRNSLRIED